MTPAPTTAVAADLLIEAVISRVDDLALGVLAFELTAADGTTLSPRSPDARIDVYLAEELVRQYSLCGDHLDPRSYQIAVLRDERGRVGSLFMHDCVEVGRPLRISSPRNHFPLRTAPSFAFVAGGIGITPILPMLRFASAQGATWRLFYGGRNRASMAFALGLAASSSNVEFYPEDEVGLMPLAQIVDLAVEAASDIYCCGPPALLEAIERSCDERGWIEHFFVERFSPTSPPGAYAPEVAFGVTLTRSKVDITIQPGETILGRLLDAGVDVSFSCEEGTCGSCETRIISGTVVHRDSVLSNQEKACGDKIMIYVSRGIDQLELDI